MVLDEDNLGIATTSVIPDVTQPVLDSDSPPSNEAPTSTSIVPDRGQGSVLRKIR